MEDRLECASGEKPQATLVVTGIRTCLTMAAGGGGPAIGEVQEQVGDLLDAAIAVRGKDLIYVGPANRFELRLTRCALMRVVVLSCQVSSIAILT